MWNEPKKPLEGGAKGMPHGKVKLPPGMPVPACACAERVRKKENLQ